MRELSHSWLPRVPLKWCSNSHRHLPSNLTLVIQQLRTSFRSCPLINMGTISNHVWKTVEKALNLIMNTLLILVHYDSTNVWMSSCDMCLGKYLLESVLTESRDSDNLYCPLHYHYGPPSIIYHSSAHQTRFGHDFLTLTYDSKLVGMRLIQI